uniref:Uncharacterized protein n=1 Tax=Vespula pensylvanica TaxID=30213 RepID=A0A834NBD2_VESPE|nr:hypothetical protein H0235_015265 [Vespula pensylvanica]
MEESQSVFEIESVRDRTESIVDFLRGDRRRRRRRRSWKRRGYPRQISTYYPFSSVTVLVLLYLCVAEDRTASQVEAKVASSDKSGEEEEEEEEEEERVGGKANLL